MKSIDFEPFSRGDVIDYRYKVDDIKKGNMGIVYLCTEVRKNEPIAIKTFDDRFFHSDANRQSFYQEASTWIQLERHPNIVEAHALKLIDGHPYLFLERIIADNPRGATLKDLFFTQTIDYRSMLQIAIHICDGMIHALQKFPNLVHRDLKSENILIGQEGLPKISDFGITRRPLVDDAVPLKNQYDLDLPFHPSQLARRMEGTPAYASPEQCQCQPLDTRSDIYSFGCILYHMTTKHLPFHRSTVEETILAHIREKPVPPGNRSNIIDKDFSRLIMQCLEKDPNKRFESFEILRMDLISLYEFTFFDKPNSFQMGVPLTVTEYIERAKSFALLEKYHHARTELMKGLHIDPSRSELYFLLGLYSYLEGQYSRAVLELKEALRGMPKHGELHEILGKAYLQLSYSEEAVMHLKESIDLAPHRPGAYHELISLYLKRGDAFKAENLLHDALENCEDKVPFFSRLAKLCNEIEDYGKEYSILEKIIQIDPDHIDSLLRLAELAVDMRRNYQAKEWTEKAAQNNPEDFEQLYRLGALYSALQNPRRAADVWKMAAATGEGDGVFYKEIATLFLLLRNYEDAWRYVLRAEEKGEDAGNLKFDIQARRLKGR